jgi:hypothetical protein
MRLIDDEVIKLKLFEKRAIVRFLAAKVAECSQDYIYRTDILIRHSTPTWQVLSQLFLQVFSLCHGTMIFNDMHVRAELLKLSFPVGQDRRWYHDKVRARVRTLRCLLRFVLVVQSDNFRFFVSIILTVVVSKPRKKRNRLHCDMTERRRIESR